MTWISAVAGKLPWWAKIAGKVVLSRLPVSGKVWQKIGLFSPGLMWRPDYAIGVFDFHYRAAGAPAAGFKYLELGPGDSVASAVVGKAYGAALGWLVDSGSYASRDMDLYRDVARRLEAERPGANLGALREVGGFEDLLRACNTSFLEHGLASLRQVPAESCDFIFSEAVLEHVPLGEFDAVMGELHRILKPGGVATHRVDFRDHLGGGWNNLRFSAGLWEAPWFAQRSGFYTNRLRLSAMTERLQGAGFAVEVPQRLSWPAPPIARDLLKGEFQYLSEEDLMTDQAHILARKP